MPLKYKLRRLDSARSSASHLSARSASSSASPSSRRGIKLPAVPTAKHKSPKGNASLVSVTPTMPAAPMSPKRFGALRSLSRKFTRRLYRTSSWSQHRAESGEGSPKRLRTEEVPPLTLRCASLPPSTEEEGQFRKKIEDREILSDLRVQAWHALRGLGCEDAAAQQFVDSIVGVAFHASWREFRQEVTSATVLRQQYDDLKKRDAEMQAHFLRETSALRDRLRHVETKALDEIKALEYSFDHIEFYEPLQYLDNSQRELVLEIVNEKIKMLFTRNPAFEKLTNKLHHKDLQIELLERRLAKYSTDYKLLRQQTRKLETDLRHATSSAGDLDREILCQSDLDDVDYDFSSSHAKRECLDRIFQDERQKHEDLLSRVKEVQRREIEATELFDKERSKLKRIASGLQAELVSATAKAAAFEERCGKQAFQIDQLKEQLRRLTERARKRVRDQPEMSNLVSDDPHELDGAGWSNVSLLEHHEMDCIHNIPASSRECVDKAVGTDKQWALSSGSLRVLCDCMPDSLFEQHVRHDYEEQAHGCCIPSDQLEEDGPFGILEEAETNCVIRQAVRTVSEYVGRASDGDSADSLVTFQASLEKLTTEYQMSDHRIFALEEQIENTGNALRHIQTQNCEPLGLGAPAEAEKSESCAVAELTTNLLNQQSEAYVQQCLALQEELSRDKAEKNVLAQELEKEIQQRHALQVKIKELQQELVREVQTMEVKHSPEVELGGEDDDSEDHLPGMSAVGPGLQLACGEQTNVTSSTPLRFTSPQELQDQQPNATEEGIVDSQHNRKDSQRRFRGCACESELRSEWKAEKSRLLASQLKVLLAEHKRVSALLARVQKSNGELRKRLRSQAADEHLPPAPLPTVKRADAKEHPQHISPCFSVCDTSSSPVPVPGHSSRAASKDQHTSIQKGAVAASFACGGPRVANRANQGRLSCRGRRQPLPIPAPMCQDFMVTCVRAK